MNPLPLVFAELKRNPLGSAAIVALISIAVGLGLAVTAQDRAIRHASTRAAERFDLIIGAPGSPTQLVLTTVYLQPAALDLLPRDALPRLVEERGAAMVAPVAVTDSYRGYIIVGTTAQFAAESGMADGRMFTHLHEAVVGSAVRLGLGETLRPEHGSAAENVLEAHSHAFEIAVVGRARPTGTPWDRAIVVPIEALWAMHDAPAGRTADAAVTAAQLGPPWLPETIDRVPAIVVKPRSVSDAYQLRTKYRTQGSVAVFPAEVLLPLYALLGDFHDVIAAMAVAFQVLILMAILLVIVAVLAGRRQSIGVLRALGAPPAFVFLTVWLQAALLIVTGVAVGAVIGWGAGRALGTFASARTGLAIDAAPGAGELWLLLGLLVAGSLLATLPSLFAMRGSAGRLLRASNA